MKCQPHWRLYQAALPLCLGLCLPALGQDTRITGRVLDPSRAAVATTVVTVTQVDSGFRRQVLSNAQGYFQLAPLPPGQYRIEALKPGFKPLSNTLVGLHPGATATIDLQLENAEVSDSVTFEARKSDVGSLLTYICGLSQGSGCETLYPIPESAIAQTDSPFLP
jgi:hypothetical protein